MRDVIVIALAWVVASVPVSFLAGYAIRESRESALDHAKQTEFLIRSVIAMTESRPAGALRHIAPTEQQNIIDLKAQLRESLKDLNAEEEPGLRIQPVGMDR